MKLSFWEKYLIEDPSGEAYKEYRKSAQWTRLRKKVLERDNHQCATCSSIGNVVHHKHYAYLANPKYEAYSCITLCKACHYRIHTNRAFKKRVKYTDNQIQKMLLKDKLIHAETIPGPV